MKNIVFCGDTHRKWVEFREAVEKYDLRDCAIIHLGDGGFGLVAGRKVEQEVLLRNNEWLKERNCIMYNIRGNHDNPYWFMGKEKFLNFLKKEDAETPAWRKEDYYYLTTYVNRFDFAETMLTLTNIKFVEDYTVLKEGGYNILCIGGAYSVDRTYQATQGRYYKKEKVRYDPIIKELTDIDIVATHTTPHFAHKPVGGNIVDTYKEYDDTLVRDLIAERRLMTKIYKEIIVQNKKVQKWFFGHFHTYYIENHNGTDFICLPPNNLYHIR